MTNHDNRRDRRRDPRVSPKGTAIVRAGAQVMRARVSNLSRGGLSMITRAAVPLDMLDCVADIDLRLDGRDSAWFHLRGTILRVSTGSIAVKLEAVPASYASAIDETVRASHHHHRVLSVVLVDASPDRRSAMTEAFRAAGCVVVEVSTPLEAIVRLGESHFEPDVIAIADSLPVTISDELRRFVDTEHPRAKLVTIGDPADGPAGLAHWLSAGNPEGDLGKRIRVMLTTWERLPPRSPGC